MSDYFEDEYGFDLREQIKGAIDSKDVELDSAGIVTFYTEEGEITFDFNDNTVKYDNDDWLNFGDCKKTAITLARSELKKLEQVAAAEKREAERVPDSYSDAFTRVAAAKGEYYKGFKDNKPRFSIDGPFQLTYSQTGDGPTVYFAYNFLTRALVISNNEDGTGGTTKLFKDVDREILEAMYQKLIDLGGQPPPLALSDAERSVANKFRVKGPGNE